MPLPDLPTLHQQFQGVARLGAYHKSEYVYVRHYTGKIHLFSLQLNMLRESLKSNVGIYLTCNCSGSISVSLAEAVEEGVKPEEGDEKDLCSRCWGTINNLARPVV